MIAEFVASGGETVATFSSIPATYKDLILSGQGRLTGGSTAIKLRVNGDTGNNYTSRRQNIYGNTLITSGYPDLAEFGGSGAPAGFASMFEAVFPNYAGTALFKPYTSVSNVAADNGGSFASQQVAGQWNATPAINQLAVFPASGGFAAGTTIRLYARS